MTHPPSPLADRFGSLCAGVKTECAQGGLTAALHGVIMALLARLFGRLEQIFQLLESGGFPPPRAVPPPPARTNPVAAAPRPRRHSARRRGPRVRVAPAQERDTAIIPAFPTAPAGFRRARRVAASIRPRPARAPPAT